MRLQELADILKKRFLSAAQGKKAVAVVLFGIECAGTLKQRSIADVCAALGIDKWRPQVVLTGNLANKATLKT